MLLFLTYFTLFQYFIFLRNISNLGVRYSIVDERYAETIQSLFPAGNIGYRYQQANGKGLVFRAFIGTVGLGISIGKSF